MTWLLLLHHLQSPTQQHLTLSDSLMIGFFSYSIPIQWSRGGGHSSEKVHAMIEQYFLNCTLIAGADNSIPTLNAGIFFEFQPWMREFWLCLSDVDGQGQYKPPPRGLHDKTNPKRGDEWISMPKIRHLSCDDGIMSLIWSAPSPRVNGLMELIWQWYWNFEAKQYEKYNDSKSNVCKNIRKIYNYDHKGALSRLRHYERGL